MYSVYFKFRGKKYKLPTNPEDITVTRSIEVENYKILASSQVSLPSSCNLEEYRFSAEFPHSPRRYSTTDRFRSPDYYEKMFKRAQKELIPLRFIASNGITKDISSMVLIKSLEIVEKAGEEGDKYISFVLQEYRAAGKKYVAVPSPPEEKKEDTVIKVEEKPAEQNPELEQSRIHKVVKGDTLMKLAKRYYGNQNEYKKIVNANPSIKNPNLIYPGQILNLP